MPPNTRFFRPQAVHVQSITLRRSCSDPSHGSAAWAYTSEDLLLRLGPQHRGRLASASPEGLHLLTILLHLSHGGDHLGNGGMDPNGIVKIGLRSSNPNGDGHALNDFTRIRAQQMYADHLLLLGLVANQLHVAIVATAGVGGPVQWLDRRLVDDDVVLAELGERLFLTVADGPILQWSKHGGRYQLVVHQLSSSTVQSICKCLPGGHCNGSQLQHPLHDISDGIDVVLVSLLCSIHRNLALPIVGDPGILQVHPGRAAGAPDGQQHGVVDAELTILGKHPHPAILSLLKLGGNQPPGKLGPRLLHKCTDLVRDLLIKASQQDRSNHDCDVEAQPGEEPGTLQGDVGRANHQGLAWRLLLPEDIITGDAALLSSLVSTQIGPTACGN
mmetsp:Transcript_40748/g.91851  ORF Transcript_40748/g.91851 Transcript_40748/m.91851 type:complete len:387 (-) Transcript_40748:474-1634(-)